MVEAAKDVGADIIGMVKINAKVLCKDIIENMKNDCPGGYHLVSKIKYTVPGERQLVSIGHGAL